MANADLQITETPPAPANLKGTGFGKFLQSKHNRNRKVTPVMPAIDERHSLAAAAAATVNLPANAVNASNSSNMEIFSSRTRIHRNCNGQASSTTTSATNIRRVRIAGSDLSETLIFGSPLKRRTDDCQFVSPAYVRSPSDGKLQSSLQNVVQLEQHGFIITPLKTTSPVSIPQQQQQHEQQQEQLKDNEPNYSSLDILSTTQRELKQSLMLRRRFNAIRWLLKPFRTRSGKKRSSQEQNRQIHAVVFKTYFVRWNKPPDERRRGSASCPVSHVDIGESNGLMRSRSAIF